MPFVGACSPSSGRASQDHAAPSSSQDFAFATPGKPSAAHSAGPSYAHQQRPLSSDHTQAQPPVQLGSAAQLQRGEESQGRQQQSTANQVQPPSAGMHYGSDTPAELARARSSSELGSHPAQKLPGGAPAQQVLLDPGRLLHPSESWDLLVAVRVASDAHTDKGLAWTAQRLSCEHTHKHWVRLE